MVRVDAGRISHGFVQEMRKHIVSDVVMRSNILSAAVVRVGVKRMPHPLREPCDATFQLVKLTGVAEHETQDAVKLSLFQRPCAQLLAAPTLPSVKMSR